MIHVNFRFVFRYNRATIPKMRKIGPCLTNFFMEKPLSLIFSPHCFLWYFWTLLQNWDKNNIYHQNGWICHKNGLKIAIVNLHRSTPCGYFKHVPGDTWQNAKLFRGNWSANIFWPMPNFAPFCPKSHLFWPKWHLFWP